MSWLNNSREKGTRGAEILAPFLSLLHHSFFLLLLCTSTYSSSIVTVPSSIPIAFSLLPITSLNFPTWFLSFLWIFLQILEFLSILEKPIFETHFQTCIFFYLSWHFLLDHLSSVYFMGRGITHQLSGMMRRDFFKTQLIMLYNHLSKTSKWVHICFCGLICLIFTWLRNKWWALLFCSYSLLWEFLNVVCVKWKILCIGMFFFWVFLNCWFVWVLSSCFFFVCFFFWTMLMIYGVLHCM